MVDYQAWASNENGYGSGNNYGKSSWMGSNPYAPVYIQYTAGVALSAGQIVVVSLTEPTKVILATSATKTRILGIVMESERGFTFSAGSSVRVAGPGQHARVYFMNGVAITHPLYGRISRTVPGVAELVGTGTFDEWIIRFEGAYSSSSKYQLVDVSLIR